MPADLRPLRVAQATSQLLKAKHLKQQPAWLPVVSRIPPSTDLARRQVPEVDQTVGSTPAARSSSPQRRRQQQRSKARLFTPREIRYVEDRLRQRFFRDRPWELARPVLLVENDGADHARYDWSKLVQPGRPTNGESVVQHQLWLMTKATPPMDEHAAYARATKEFERLRMEEAVERKIAVEEALTFGATFGKTDLEVGVELENKVLEGWREKVIASRALSSPGSTPAAGRGQSRDDDDESN